MPKETEKKFDHPDLDAPESTAAERGDDFVPTEDDLEEESETKAVAKDKAEEKADDKAVAKDKDNKAKADEEKADEEKADEEKADEEKADEKEEVADEKTKDEASKDDDDKADDKADDKPDLRGFIPKSRYNSLRGRYDALLKRTESRATEKVEPVGERKTAEQLLSEIDKSLEDLDEPLTKAMADGDVSKTREIRSKERKLLATRTDVVASQRAGTSAAQTRSEVEYDVAVDAIEADFPELNPDMRGTKEKPGAYDDALARDISFDAVAFERSGMPAAAALVRAVSLHTAGRGLVPLPERGKLKAVEKKESARDTKTKVDKNVDAANKQPPSLRQAGEDSHRVGIKGKLDPAKLTDKDLEALPEETMKRMRGDFL